MPEGAIGVSVQRKEDDRFLRGHGRYTDDITLPQQSYAVVLRAPLAHARIRSVDTADAKAMPGVLAVFTGEDVAADGLGGLPCGWQVTGKEGQVMQEPPHPLLVTDKVRHVGDNVALVVAESLAEAKDAAERPSSSTTTPCRRSVRPLQPWRPTHRRFTTILTPTSATTGRSATPPRWSRLSRTPTRWRGSSW